MNDGKSMENPKEPSKTVAENDGFLQIFPEKTIWGFPEIRVPPNHPFIDGFSLVNHPAMGVPHLWNPQSAFSQPNGEGNQTCVLINLDDKGNFKSETVPCQWVWNHLSKPWDLYYPTEKLLRYIDILFGNIEILKLIYLHYPNCSLGISVKLLSTAAATAGLGTV